MTCTPPTIPISAGAPTCRTSMSSSRSFSTAIARILGRHRTPDGHRRTGGGRKCVRQRGDLPGGGENPAGPHLRERRARRRVLQDDARQRTRPGEGARRHHGHGRGVPAGGGRLEDACTDPRCGVPACPDERSHGLRGRAHPCRAAGASRRPVGVRGLSRRRRLPGGAHSDPCRAHQGRGRDHGRLPRHGCPGQGLHQHALFVHLLGNLRLRSLGDGPQHSQQRRFLQASPIPST